MSTFLTIAIPTCNRSESLDEQLRRITIQVSKLSAVDVLISDNASTDNTQIVVEKYIEQFNFITYFRNDKNVGLDGNVYKLFELSKGEYVWFLTDDDYLEENIIENVIKTLEIHKPTVITFDEIQENSNANTISTDKVNTHYNFNDRASIISFWRAIMLSRLIVMRLPVNITNMSNLPDSTYPQVTLALRLLRQRFNLCDASLPVIKRKTGRVFKNLFKLYLLDIRQAIMNSEWDFATKRLLPETGDFLKSFIKVQLMERAGYFYSKERLNLITFTQAWREYTNSVPDRLYLIIIYIVNITPKFIAKNYLLL